jgi:hypothetical protein
MGAVEESRLDNTRLQFTLVTGDGNRYLFDVRTGEIIRDPQTARSWWWLGVFLAAAVAIAFCVWRIQRRSRVAT